MNVVISIPDKAYNWVMEQWETSDIDSPINHICMGVKNGTVLSKCALISMLDEESKYGITKSVENVTKYNDYILPIDVEKCFDNIDRHILKESGGNTNG